MDFYIYYEIKNKGKNEYIRTNHKILQDYIEKAQQYYNLKSNTEIEGVDTVFPFKTGDFILYLLSHNTSFDCETNMKISFIKQYLQECIVNKKYFTKNIFLSFIRDILQIPELKYSVQYYSSNYYNDIDISKEINRKSIRTRLSTFEENTDKINIDKIYICDGIIMFILVSIFEILTNNYKIHKCINCGKLFINNKISTNTRYCNYISPQNKNKTCFKYRKTAPYQEVRKSNEIHSIHNSIYDLLNKRLVRAEVKSIKDNPYIDDELVIEYQNSLFSFKSWYSEKTREYKSNTITNEQFVNLLKEKYTKYKEEKKYGSSRANKK